MTQPDMPFRAEDFGPFEGEIVTAKQAASIANDRLREMARCEVSGANHSTEGYSYRIGSFLCKECGKKLTLIASEEL